MAKGGHAGETTVLLEIMDGSKPEQKSKNSLWTTFEDPGFHIKISFLNNRFLPQGAKPYPECKSNRMISSFG